jgi:hypothetical protein
MLLWPFALTNHPVNFVHILTDKGMQRRRYTCLCSSVFEKHNNASVIYRQVCKNQSTYIFFDKGCFIIFGKQLHLASA